MASKYIALPLSIFNTLKHTLWEVPMILAEHQQRLALMEPKNEEWILKYVCWELPSHLLASNSDFAIRPQ